MKFSVCVCESVIYIFTYRSRLKCNISEVLLCPLFSNHRPTPNYVPLRECSHKYRAVPFGSLRRRPQITSDSVLKVLSAHP